MSRSLVAGIIASLVVAQFAFMARNAAPRRARGLRRLDWPVPMRAFVAFMVPASFGIAWMASQAKPDQAVTAALVSGCFVIGALYLAYCVLFYRVWWTSEGIGSWHPLGGARFVAWNDVEEGRYVASVQAFYVKGGGTRVWYSPMQSGIGALHRFIGRRLKPLPGLMLDGPGGDTTG